MGSAEVALRQAAAIDCWCAKTRKRCEYHEGYEDGFEAALQEAARVARSPE